MSKQHVTLRIKHPSRGKDTFLSGTVVALSDTKVTIRKTVSPTGPWDPKEYTTDVIVNRERIRRSSAPLAAPGTEQQAERPI